MRYLITPSKILRRIIHHLVRVRIHKDSTDILDRLRNAPITIDDVHNRFASLLTSNTFYGRREILDILKFLDRPDITEEIILRAYDRHSVMEVMTE
jgi:hypothetical protein